MFFNFFKKKKAKKYLDMNTHKDKIINYNDKRNNVIQNKSDLENLSSQVEDMNTLQKIGAGGIGEVYSYREKRKYVLKRANIKNSFFEYRILKKLQEADLCDYFLCPYGYFYVQGQEDKRYIKLEYLSGYKTIPEIRNYSIRKKDLSNLMEKMMYIIYILHLNNMVHTDIKPENIMVEVNEEKKELTGNVKFIDVGSFLHREDAIRIGNVDYMRMAIFTPFYIDYNLLLPLIFSKYQKYKFMYLFSEGNTKSIYDVNLVPPNLILSNNNTKTSYPLLFNDDIVTFMKNRETLIFILKNTYLVSKKEEYDIVMEDKNGNGISLFSLVFREFFDFEILKENDIYAMNIVNGLLPKMVKII